MKCSLRANRLQCRQNYVSQSAQSIPYVATKSLGIFFLWEAGSFYLIACFISLSKELELLEYTSLIIVVVIIAVRPCSSCFTIIRIFSIILFLISSLYRLLHRCCYCFDDVFIPNKTWYINKITFILAPMEQLKSISNKHTFTSDIDFSLYYTPTLHTKCYTFYQAVADCSNIEWANKIRWIAQFRRVSDNIINRKTREMF